MNSESDIRYVFFDLDGTVGGPKLNNTFDFIENYLVYKKRRASLVRKYILTAISRMLPMGGRRRRAFLIASFFKGLSYDELRQYSECCYMPLFMTHANEKVLEIVQREKGDGKRIVLLTACTEIPARTISESLGFDECIPTTFRTADGRIEGVGDDTFNDLKISALERAGLAHVMQQSDYYVDDIEAESGLVGRFGRVFKVDGDDIEVVRGDGDGR
ncbi:MAG TPA: HAD family hydrolase [Candidatus Methanofastidiosa archaeon]|nr:HAD family hydrolase [Candidatus Methanofastidiosa archaeon]